MQEAGRLGLAKRPLQNTMQTQVPGFHEEKQALPCRHIYLYIYYYLL